MSKEPMSTFVAGGKEFEIVDKAAREKLEGIVTPQMFGAKGDGVTDDTEAFQSALDTGYDVFVSLTHGEHYIISQTLEMKAHMQSLFGNVERRLFDIGWSTSSHNGYIDFVGSGTFLSNNDYTGVYLHHLSIYGGERTTKTKTAINLDGSNIDYHIDSKIEECAINGFHYIVHNNGRGTYFINNYVAYYDDAFYHEYTVGDGDGRGIYFCGNKCHNGGRLIELAPNTVLSYAVISGNFSDSIAYLMEAGSNTSIDRTLITNNTFNLMEATYWASWGLLKSISHTEISNNIVRSGKSTSRMIFTSNALEEFNKNIISSNIFENCTQDCIFLQGPVSGSVISSNVISNSVSGGESYCAGIRINTNVDDCSFVGNHIDMVATSEAIKLTATVSGTQIIGNSSSSSSIVSIGTAGTKPNNIQS